MKNKLLRGPGTLQYQFSAGLMVFVWDKMPQTVVIEDTKITLLVGPQVQKAVKVRSDEDKKDVWNTLEIWHPIALWVELGNDNKAFVNHMDQQKFDDVIKLVPSQTGDTGFPQLRDAFQAVASETFLDK